MKYICFFIGIINAVAYIAERDDIFLIISYIIFCTAIILEKLDDYER